MRSHCASTCPQAKAPKGPKCVCVCVCMVRRDRCIYHSSSCLQSSIADRGIYTVETIHMLGACCVVVIFERNKSLFVVKYVQLDNILLYYICCTKYVICCIHDQIDSTILHLFRIKTVHISQLLGRYNIMPSHIVFSHNIARIHRHTFRPYHRRRR